MARGSGARAGENLHVTEGAANMFFKLLNYHLHVSRMHLFARLHIIYLEVEINMNRPNILVFAGSTRSESVNRKLARQAVDALRAAGADATFADLRDYPLPLYDGDLEDIQGRPATAVAL